MLENITPNRRRNFGWPIFATRLMLFRVHTLQVLEITVPKFIDFGRWTIFVTHLMLLGYSRSKVLEIIMPNRCQHSGVNLGEKSMFAAGLLPSPFFAMVLLLKTCDKSCDSSFRGEFSRKKVCFPLGFSHQHFSGWHYYCRRVTKVARAPLGVKKNYVFAGDQWTFAIWMAFFAFQLPRRGSNFCHTSRVIMQICVRSVIGLEWKAVGVKQNDVFAGDQWTIAIWVAFFAFQLSGGMHDFISGPIVRWQLLSHVCRNNANSLSKCRWSRVKRVISFQVLRWENNFCHTSAVIMQLYLWNVAGLQRNAYLFHLPIFAQLKKKVHHGIFQLLAAAGVQQGLELSKVHLVGPPLTTWASVIQQGWRCFV